LASQSMYWPWRHIGWRGQLQLEAADAGSATGSRSRSVRWACRSARQAGRRQGLAEPEIVMAAVRGTRGSGNDACSR
jgi:hypothetical protein